MELDQSEPPYKRRKLATIEKHVATVQKHINDLPDELLVHIFRHLPRYDQVKRVSEVCWRWHEAAFDQDLWKVIDAWIGDNMSYEDLSRLVKHSTKSLLINLDEIILDETFEKVLEKCSTLKTLSFNVERPDTDSQRSQQVSSDTDLVVNSHSRRSISRITLLSIGQHCINLRDLNIFRLDALTDTMLIAMLRGCTTLTQLLVYDCKTLTTSALTAIGEYAKQLLFLGVFFKNDVCLSVRSIKKLVDGCQKLRVLNLQAKKSKLEEIKNLKIIGELKTLKFIKINISNALIDDDAVIYWLSQCKDLHTIVLCGLWNQSITDKTLEAIASIGSNLEKFEVKNWCGVTDQGLEHLGKSKSIRSICMHYEHNFTSVTAKGIVNLAKNLSKLKRLTVTVGHSNHPLIKQMKDISSMWKGVYPIEFRQLQFTQ